eukprot:363776-Chlamydomonas_euryale.AAC.1
MDDALRVFEAQLEAQLDAMRRQLQAPPGGSAAASSLPPGLADALLRAAAASGPGGDGITAALASAGLLPRATEAAGDAGWAMGASGAAPEVNPSERGAAAEPEDRGRHASGPRATTYSEHAPAGAAQQTHSTPEAARPAAAVATAAATAGRGVPPPSPPLLPGPSDSLSDASREFFASLGLDMDALLAPLSPGSVAGGTDDGHSARRGGHSAGRGDGGGDGGAGRDSGGVGPVGLSSGNEHGAERSDGTRAAAAAWWASPSGGLLSPLPLSPLPRDGEGELSSADSVSSSIDRLLFGSLLGGRPDVGMSELGDVGRMGALETSPLSSLTGASDLSELLGPDDDTGAAWHAKACPTACSTACWPARRPCPPARQPARPPARLPARTPAHLPACLPA